MTARLPFDDLGALPPPDEEARAHGERVLALIRSSIDRAGGSITFADYMNLALHAPGLGYYSAGSTKFGARGDFVTAPEISPLFGRCLATQVEEVLLALGGGDVLEIGAGTGTLACELLAELERRGVLATRYFILETSADLRARQAALFAERIPRLANRIEWLDQLPERGFCGVMFANELLDAMPVHRLVLDSESGLSEMRVGWRGDRFGWGAAAPEDDRLAVRMEAIFAVLGRSSFRPGYCFELNLAMESWMSAAAATLEQGALLLIDYGYPRREYYHPERGAGTLMCHYRHRAHDDPLILPGLQDITCHIDFTRLAEMGAEVGDAHGLRLAGYTTQAWFLFGCGLQEFVGAQLQEAGDAERARLSAQVQRLTLPGEMGAKFKVIAWSRQLDISLRGFSMRDERCGL
ncbi:MAG: SAM-dependent methyltransferase [Chromatiales bacterium]|jgi:SAM-dependent MidA family methyltransferase|nr:SAM-dependent methyltransferase [Chromatiales bacterium]